MEPLLLQLLGLAPAGDDTPEIRVPGRTVSAQETDAMTDRADASGGQVSAG